MIPAYQILPGPNLRKIPHRSPVPKPAERVAVIPDVPEDGVVDVARGVLAIEGIRQAGTEDHHEPQRKLEKMVDIKHRRMGKANRQFMGICRNHRF